MCIRDSLHPNPSAPSVPRYSRLRRSTLPPVCKSWIRHWATQRQKWLSVVSAFHVKPTWRERNDRRDCVVLRPGLWSQYLMSNDLAFGQQIGKPCSKTYRLHQYNTITTQCKYSMIVTDRGVAMNVRGRVCKVYSAILDYKRWARRWFRFLGSQPAADINGRLPLLSTKISKNQRRTATGSTSYSKSISLNPFSVKYLLPKVELMHLLRMCLKQMVLDRLRIRPFSSPIFSEETPQFLTYAWNSGSLRNMSQSLVEFCWVISFCEGWQRSSRQYLQRSVWRSCFSSFGDQSSWNYESVGPLDRCFQRHPVVAFVLFVK